MWLLDANMDVHLAPVLARLGIQCDTATQRGWNALSNGRLVTAAVTGGFDRLLTRDRLFGESASRALRAHPTFAVVLVNLPQQRWEHYQTRFLEAWTSSPIEPKPGSLIEWPWYALLRSFDIDLTHVPVLLNCLRHNNVVRLTLPIHGGSRMPVYRPMGAEIVSQSMFGFRASDSRPPLRVNAEISPVVGTGSSRPFQDIDFGKPLNVVLRKVYTGKYPEKHLFSSRKPMLVSSSIKDMTTTAAATRALNILKSGVVAHSNFSGPDAAEEGTALLYYSPAMASPFLTVSLTLIFEDFAQELFDRASKLFGSLAAIPIFMPAAGYLLGASTIVKLVGDAGSQILNGNPVLNENLQIDFSFGGGSLPQAGYWIFSSGALDVSKYQFDPMRGLIQQNNSSPYSGDDPVIVVSVDGTQVDGVSNFTPLLASASILGRFFSQKDGAEVATDTILEAVKLFNDLTYRKKAEDTKARLAALPTESPDRKKLEGALQAFNQNIGESRLQLSLT